MAAATLNTANTRAFFTGQADVPKLKNQLSAESVSRADASLMRMKPGTFIDVEYRPTEAERADRAVFEALVGHLYAAKGAGLRRVLESPDMEQFWTQWQRGDNVTFPHRITLAPPASRPRALEARVSQPLSGAFVDASAGVNPRR